MYFPETLNLKMLKHTCNLSNIHNHVSGLMCLALKGKPHLRKIHVQTEFCQIAIQPPPSQANGRFVAGIFRRKLANSLKQRF